VKRLTVELEIICIGNELLIGKVLNTNAYWLGGQATNLGVDVKRVTVVQDIVFEIAQVILEVLARKPQFIITTGGLGPTFDDKTLQGIAKALNRNSEVNPKALEMVKEKYIQYAIAKKRPVGELTSAQIKMATLPEKTEPVKNPIGTAPSIRVDIDGTVLFALPGVPSEMEAIFTQSIAPIVKQTVGDVVFCEKSIFVSEIMESTLAPLIDKVMNDNPGIYIKSHPKGEENKPHIEIHLTLRAQSKNQPSEKILKALNELINLIQQTQKNLH